ncbi:MAG: hypothetical protein ACQESB_05695, partial [Elusimicrobiota bacterium]
MLYIKKKKTIIITFFLGCFFTVNLSFGGRHPTVSGNRDKIYESYLQSWEKPYVNEQKELKKSQSLDNPDTAREKSEINSEDQDNS